MKRHFFFSKKIRKEKRTLSLDRSSKHSKTERERERDRKSHTKHAQIETKRRDFDEKKRLSMELS